MIDAQSRLPSLPPVEQTNGHAHRPFPALRWPARRKPSWRLLAGGGVLVSVAVVLLAWISMAPSAATRPVRPDGALLLVAANGVVEGASRERPLAPEVAGTLKAVHVQVNDEVSAGTLLFELVNDSQQAQVTLAEAELAGAQAQLDQAEADLVRGRQMVAGSAMSRSEFDQHQLRVRTARARKLEGEARLRLAQAELAKTQVRAPVAGRVLQIYKEAGVAVGPATRGAGEPVLRLADVSKRRVRAFVEELDAGRVRPGQAATVTADGFPGRAYEGRVVQIAGRMGKDAPESDAPGEYKDVFFREVLIELTGSLELPLNLRVQVRLDLALKAGEVRAAPAVGP